MRSNTHASAGPFSFSSDAFSEDDGDLRRGGSSAAPRAGRPGDDNVAVEGLPAPTTVAVENLTRNVTAAHLCEIFAAMGGAVVDVQVAVNARTGACEGRARVTLATAAEARAAVARMDGGQLDGCVLRCRLDAPDGAEQRRPPAAASYRRDPYDDEQRDRPRRQ